MKIHVASDGDFYNHVREWALESICSISQAKIEDIITMRKQELGVKNEILIPKNMKKEWQFQHEQVYIKPFWVGC